MPPIDPIPPQSVEIVLDRSKLTLERMDRLGYQDLLSKCIQDGLPEGGNLKLSSRIQLNAEPAGGTGRLLENSMSGSREDTSGAAEGPLVESDAGHRVVVGMDGASLDKHKPQFVPAPKSVDTGHMLGKAVRTEDVKIDGVPRSLFKSARISTKLCTDVLPNQVVEGRNGSRGASSPMFSFRSLLEGAMSASGVQRRAEVDMQGVLHVEPQNVSLLTEKYPFPGERRLVDERHDGVLAGSSTPLSCREVKIFSGDGMTGSSKEDQYFARRIHDSGPLIGDTAGDSVRRVSYSSLLQAQLGDSLPETRTGISHKEAGDVEAHSLLVNSQLQPVEVKGEFLSLLNQTSPFLPSVAQRPCFPSVASVSINEKLSGVHLLEDSSGSLAVNDSRSADNALGRGVGDASESAAVLASPVPTRMEEGVSPAEVVVGRASFMVADSTCIDEEISDVELFEELSRALAIDESGLAGYVSNRDVIDSSDAAAVPASPAPTRMKEDVSQAEVVVERSNFVVADSVSTDDKILDVQPSEESSGAFAVDESQSAESVPKKVVIDSSEAAAIPAPPVPNRVEEYVLERASFVVAPSVSNDGHILDVQRPEGSSQALALDESRFAELVLKRDSIDSSDAATVSASPVPVRTEEVVAGSMGVGEKMSDAVVSEKPSHVLTLDELRSSDNILTDSSEAASVSASPVPTRTEDVPPAEFMVERASVVVADSVPADENTVDVQLSVESSQALARDESLSAEFVLGKDAMDSSEAAAEPTSLVPKRTENDVPPSEVVVDKEADLCEEAVVHTELGKNHLLNVNSLSNDSLSVNPFDGQVFNERPQSPSERLEVVNFCVEDQSNFVNAGTTLESSCRTGLNQMGDPNADSVVVLDGNPCDVQIKYGTSSVSETDDALLQESVVEKPSDIPSNDLLSSKEVEDHLLNGNAVVKNSSPCLFLGGQALDQEAHFAPRQLLSSTFPGECRLDLTQEGTVFESVVFRQADLKQTENVKGLFEEEQEDKICSAQMISSTGNVSLKSEADNSLPEVLLETELDISKSELVHTEDVKDDLNVSAVPEKSPLFMRTNGHVVSEEPDSTPEHVESISRCPEGRFEPLDAGAVVGSSWQAGPNHTEGIKCMVIREQEDNICDFKILEDFMGQDAGATEHRLIGGDYGSGLHMSSVGSVEITSTTASPHVNGNILVAERIYTDRGDQMVSPTEVTHSRFTEEKAEHEHIPGALEGSSEVKQPEVEQYKAHILANQMPESQMAILPSSESLAVNQGLIAIRSCYESGEFPLSELIVKPGIQNEEERSPEGHVGEIVNDVTDSGNSDVPADQLLSTDPDAITEGLRQVFLRESDATVSDSLESVHVTGADFGAAQMGREVQSPLEKKSKDRHTRHLDDLGDRLPSHFHDLEGGRTRHLDDLVDRRTKHLDNLEENEEQPYSSPLNGTLNDQLVGAEVRAFKKKNRARVYNHEKALQGSGRPQFHPPGSKRKRHLLHAGSRCRRTRHIDPDHPVPVFIEGRDEGFESMNGGAFSRWVAQDEGIAAPFPAAGKRARKHGQELDKPIIAIPSFRVVADYEDRQQEVENRRNVQMQLQFGSSIQERLMKSSTVRPSDYDMDDEDERWLHAWNKRLARAGLNQPISEDKFEEIIEYFERRSAQLEVTSGADVLGPPVTGGSLPSTSPSSTNPITSGIPVPENAPALNPPTVRSGHPPWTAGRQAMIFSSIQVDSIGRESASPASTVRFQTWTSKNERSNCKPVVDAAKMRPSESSLQKSFEPPSQKKPSDDCCICNGGEDEENNPVYTCKRCLIHVHQSCYGIREKFRNDEGRVIAPSNWCCRKCEAVAVGTAQANVSCVLCRKRGGALKPTVAPQKWAHVACALYTNETFFVDPDAMEPIDGIAAVASRANERQDRCGLCGVKRGICSLCSVKDCRAPFHISCGVSQGASFELRQSKQKVVGVRSFCPRHARTTPMDLKVSHMVSSSTSSGATVSATASGSISTASSMDYREEGSSRQSISHPDDSVVEAPWRTKNLDPQVADLTDNVHGRGLEDAGRERPKGIRFTLKRRWDESCTQVSEEGLSIDRQEKSAGTGVTKDKMEAQGGKSTWHVVEPGQKLKKIKFKFGRLAQNQGVESSPMLVQHERIDNKDPEPGKTKELIPPVCQVSGDVAVNDKDLEILKGLSENSFAKEVKELIILEEAMKSGVAPLYVMREAFVYWRAKRAEFKGSLLCELHHDQWSKSQRIFNKDANDVEYAASGKMGSPPSVPLAKQPSLMPYEKMLEKAKELRKQLERLRSLSAMVVQREKLKFNQQLVLGTLASVELNRTQSSLRERSCVWCPSTKTLLKCQTCPRSFCFNCFKHRKGFGVKGWMAAMKQPLYSCTYCRELSVKAADFSSTVDPAPNKFVDGGVVSNSVIVSKPVGGGRGKGIGKGRGKGRGWQGSDNPKSAVFRPTEGGVSTTAKKTTGANEDQGRELRIGHGKGNGWIERDSVGPSSSTHSFRIHSCNLNGVNKLRKPIQLEAGLNKFLHTAQGQIELSSFETTLRKLNILRCTSTDANHDSTISARNPSEDLAEEIVHVRGSRPVIDKLEMVMPNTSNGGNATVSCSLPVTRPASAPALLVYKKKRGLVLGERSESPPSAYDLQDEATSPSSSHNA